MEDKEEMTHFFAISLEQCWFLRNQKMQGDPILSIQDLCKLVDKNTRLYFKAAVGRKVKSHGQIDKPLWIPPPAGFRKFNFDAGFDDFHAYFGIVMRDEYGTIITAWNGRFFTSSPFAAEAEAALQAMTLGIDLGLHNIILEGDALNVINALKGVDSSCEWQGRQAILQGRQLFHSQPFWSLYYSLRDRNRTTHNLVKWSKSQHVFGRIDPVLLPPSVFCDRGGTLNVSCNSVIGSNVSNEDG